MANILVVGSLAAIGAFICFVRPAHRHPLLLIAGSLLLAATWCAVSWNERLFAEAHLVGYYCCVQPQDLPPAGTFARATSDFFRSAPGQHIFAAVFVLASGAIGLYRLRAGQSASGLLAFLLAAGLAYLLASVLLTMLGWQISAWANGAQQTAYKDAARTWYGIALHAVLWAGYLWGISKLSLPTHLPPAQAARPAARSA
jgi:hypothetical protein